MFGEFGDIEVITPSPPTETQQQARLNEELKQAATAMAPLRMPTPLASSAMRTPATLPLAALPVTLYRLPQSDGWPTEVNWPEMPQ
ncbi:hypothetical protein [Aeromonas salmonicida]|uniref:hypothetical protein n=1 Tax=Aeromonas salmonicida TaxID=645 RepID=UPI002163403E|nr:hypothetical protein [Aeromonas salmonicida]